MTGLANIHNGNLSAFSEGEEKGAEFRLELPAVLEDRNAPVRVSHVESEAPLGSEPPPASILYAPSGDGVEVRGATAVNAAPVEPRTQGQQEKEGEKAENKKDNKKEATLTAVAHHDAVRSVLVVDDSGPSRKVLCRLLRNAGYTCYEAADGEDCVTKMTQFKQDGQAIDMVFMDFEMPKMNGPDATQALRDMGLTIPIIGVTGNVLPADKEYFLNHGANAVLHKPLSIEQLKAEILKYNNFSSSSIE